VGAGTDSTRTSPSGSHYGASSSLLATAGSARPGKADQKVALNTQARNTKETIMVMTEASNDMHPQAHSTT
jgi:hypothetical protein